MRISERISQLAGSEAKPDESQALFLKYLKCGAHLGDILSAGKYIGDGACADNPQQDNKP